MSLNVLKDGLGTMSYCTILHSYDILGAGMLWKPKDLHKIR
jgi:hypothetical protein